MELVLTCHAREMARRREIDDELIRQVAQRPEQRLPGPASTVVLQGRFFDSRQAKTMLLRLIAEQAGDQLRVLTLYKTSRIEKYWKREGESE